MQDLIKIEKIKEEDIQKVKELLSQTWKATYGKYYPLEAVEKITNAWHDPKMLLAQSRDPNIYFSAAKNKDGTIAGIITVRKVDNATIFMNRLYVHPSFQGQGIGKKLLNSAFLYFPSAKTIRVDCEKRNESGCGFYMKQGFSVIGEENEVVEGVSTTAVHFEKNIDH